MAVKIIDKGWKKLKLELEKLQRTSVKVGVLSSAEPYPAEDGEGPKTVAQIASINEFGSPKQNIPERPFMRQSFDKNIQKLSDFKEKAIYQVIDLKTNSMIAANKLGIFFKGIIQKEIASGDFKPNSPYTVAKKTRTNNKKTAYSKVSKSFKGSVSNTKPLIDTGHLRSSINYEVEK